VVVLVSSDFKLKYAGSVLGYVWSLARPLALFSVLYVVFGLLVRFADYEQFPLYLLLGLVLFTFFSEATNAAKGWNRLTPSADWLLLVPLIVEFYAFTLGLSLALAALNVRFIRSTSRRTRRFSSSRGRCGSSWTVSRWTLKRAPTRASHPGSSTASRICRTSQPGSSS